MLTTIVTHLIAAAVGGGLVGIYGTKAVASLKADIAAINVKLQSLKL